MNQGMGVRGAGVSKGAAKSKPWRSCVQQGEYS